MTVPDLGSRRGRASGPVRPRPEGGDREGRRAARGSLPATRPSASGLPIPDAGALARRSRRDVEELLTLWAARRSAGCAARRARGSRRTRSEPRTGRRPCGRRGSCRVARPTLPPVTVQVVEVVAADLAVELALVLVDHLVAPLATPAREHANDVAGQRRAQGGRVLVAVGGREILGDRADLVLAQGPALHPGAAAPPGSPNTWPSSSPTATSAMNTISPAAIWNGERRGRES